MRSIGTVTALEASEVARRLGVDLAVGLSQAEAAAGCRAMAPIF